MVSWSPPVASFDYYRVSYRPTQGNKVPWFLKDEWDLELDEDCYGRTSVSQGISPSCLQFPSSLQHAASE